MFAYIFTILIFAAIAFGIYANNSKKHRNIRTNQLSPSSSNSVAEKVWVAFDKAALVANDVERAPYYKPGFMELAENILTIRQQDGPATTIEDLTNADISYSTAQFLFRISYNGQLIAISTSAPPFNQRMYLLVPKVDKKWIKIFKAHGVRVSKVFFGFTS